MARYEIRDPALQASITQAAGGSSAAYKLAEPAEYVSILIAVTAAGTSATFTVEWSNDGVTWAQADTPDTFTAITTAVNRVKDFSVKGVYCRLVWAVTGSFTFSATASVRGSRAFE